MALGDERAAHPTFDYYAATCTRTGTIYTFRLTAADVAIGIEREDITFFVRLVFTCPHCHEVHSLRLGEATVWGTPPGLQPGLQKDQV